MTATATNPTLTGSLQHAIDLAAERTQDNYHTEALQPINYYNYKSKPQHASRCREIAAELVMLSSEQTLRRRMTPAMIEKRNGLQKEILNMLTPAERPQFVAVL